MLSAPWQPLSLAATTLPPGPRSRSVLLQSPARRVGRRRNKGAGVRRHALANSSQEDIARPPSWKETLEGAAFWANPNHWDKVPSSLYWKLTFVFLKIVGTIGGYRGRAAFARKSGLQPLMGRREEAAKAVDETAKAHLERFPSLAARLGTAGGPAIPLLGGTSPPCLAVVLPAYARCAQDVEELRATLRALSKQSRRPDTVLVVDDASPFDLSPAMDGWPDSDSLALIRMTRNTGPAGARSVGMRLLRAWVAGRDAVACLTDSDAVPDVGWCQAMFEAQQRTPGIVSGPTLAATSSHTGRFHDHFGNLNGRWTWDDPKGVLLYGCTCNFSIDLNAVGDAEFDPIFSRPGFEDIEYCWRVRVEKGVYTRYCKEAVMYHEYDRGPVGLYRQFWKYGNTEPIMAWMHPKFTFQGSRQVTAGFQDPREPEASSTAKMARSAVRGLDGFVRMLGLKAKE